MLYATLFEDEITILKVAREKQLLQNKKSATSNQKQWRWSNLFKVLQEKNLSTRITYWAILSLEINVSKDLFRQRLEDFLYNFLPCKKYYKKSSWWEKVTPVKNSDLQEVVKIAGNGKYVRKYKKILWVPFSCFTC